MLVQEIYKFAYVKEYLPDIFPDPREVLDEYLMDWMKDYYDYERTYSDEELRAFREFTPEQILEWLEEATEFVWAAHHDRIRKEWKSQEK